MRCRRATALQLAASGKRAALVLFLIAALVLFLIAADATKTNKNGCACHRSHDSPARLLTVLCRAVRRRSHSLWREATSRRPPR